MKSIILSFSLVLSVIVLSAQTPVKDVTEWTLRIEKVNNQSVDLIADVTVEPGWYIYSRFLADDEGPIPTSFTFDSGFKAGTPREEGNKIEEYDPIFEMHVSKFSERAVFTTRVTLPPGKKSVSGHYVYMCCDNTQCLPPIKQTFNLAVPQ